jgi:phage gpG-like protein
MPLAGDFRKLAALREAAARVGTGRWRAPLSRLLAARALELVQAQFDRSQDPYGQRWKAPQFRRGRPLLNTGNLRSSFDVTSSASGFPLRSKHPGARLHNYGGVVRPVRARVLAFRVGGTRGGHGRGARWVFAKKVVIPQRRILPAAGKLGGTWASALRATAAQFMRDQLQGRR